MNYYDQGDLVRLTAAFTGSNGSAVDPGGLTFYIVGPNTTATYIYGTDAELVKDSTGNYHVDFSVPTTGSTAAGVYTYRFEATGDNQAATEEKFVVENSGVHG